MLVAFKVYAQNPSGVPEGVPSSFPWMIEYPASSDEAQTLMAKGFKVVSPEEYDAYTKAVYPYLKVQEVIEDAIIQGDKLLVEFAAENVLLGITQAGKTSEVMEKLASVNDAISTGSLYEAISRIKAIPVEDYDTTFITQARLLTFIHKIEQYLGMPKSGAWN